MNQKTHTLISNGALESLKKMVEKLDADNKMLLKALIGMNREFGFDVVHSQPLVHDERMAIIDAMDAIAKATE